MASLHLVGTAWIQVPVLYGKNRPTLVCNEFPHELYLVLLVKLGKYRCFMVTTRKITVPWTHKMQKTSISQGFVLSPQADVSNPGCQLLGALLNHSAKCGNYLFMPEWLAWQYWWPWAWLQWSKQKRWNAKWKGAYNLGHQKLTARWYWWVMKLWNCYDPLVLWSKGFSKMKYCLTQSHKSTLNNNI